MLIGRFHIHPVTRDVVFYCFVDVFLTTHFEELIVDGNQHRFAIQRRSAKTFTIGFSSITIERSNRICVAIHHNEASSFHASDK